MKDLSSLYSFAFVMFHPPLLARINVFCLTLDFHWLHKYPCVYYILYPNVCKEYHHFPIVLVCSYACRCLLPYEICSPSLFLCILIDIDYKWVIFIIICTSIFYWQVTFFYVCYPSHSLITPFISAFKLLYIDSWDDWLEC